MSGLHLSGQTTIWADRETVWAALHDVDVLAACIPGCQSLERLSPDFFEVGVEASAGPVSALLDGSVEIVESQPPCRLRLNARGGGAALLDITGSVSITLAACAAGSRASWEAEIEPSGLLLRLSFPFLAGLAQRHIDQFVVAFAARVGRPPTSRRSHRCAGINGRPPPA